MKTFRLLLPLALLASAAAAPAQDQPTLNGKLEALAASGNAEAAYHAGMAYERGLNGAPKDPKKALNYFKQAAEGGDPLGSYKLGSYYDGEGQGVVTDDAELALKHKLVAAKAGYAPAQHDVAKFFYEKGEVRQALEWLTAAAGQGHRESLAALASLYSGEGKVPKNAARSYAYLLILHGGSADSAPEKTRKLLADLRGKLAPAEFAEANRIVTGWKSKPSILTLHALSGQKSAQALVDRAAPAAKEKAGPELAPAEAQSPKG